MTITTEDIGTGDPVLAARILAHARYVIAPRLDELTGDARAAAVAIIAGVFQEARARGARGIASQGVGTASVRYLQVSSWFTADDRAALAALVGTLGVSSGSAPRGEFPRPSRVVSALFPEEV